MKEKTKSVQKYFDFDTQWFLGDGVLKTISKSNR